MELSEFISKANVSLGDDVELEFRLYLDKRQSSNVNSPVPVEQLPEVIRNVIGQKQPKITRNIDIIYKMPSMTGKFIQKFVYEKSLAKSSRVEYSKKEELIEPYFSNKPIHHRKKRDAQEENSVTYPIPFKLAVNKETPIKPDEHVPQPDWIKDKPDQVRVKLRLSVPIDDTWQLDITFVKESLSVELSHLKNLRDTILGYKITTEELPYAECSHIEFELENITHESIDTESIDVLQSVWRLLLNKGECDNSAMLSYISDDILQNKRRGGTFQETINKVIELTRDDFMKTIIPHAEAFTIVDKADGHRAFVIINVGKKKTEAFIIAQQYCKNISNLVSMSNFAESKYVLLNDEPIKKFVADAEILEGKTEEHILLFDVLMFDNQNLTREPFDYRRLFLREFASFLKDCRAKDFIDMKLFKHIDAIKTMEERIKQLPYETDGIIFTSRLGLYKTAQNYKWKPTHKMTIDFLCKKCPDNLLSVYPYISKVGLTLYFLFVGIDKEMCRKLQIKRIPNWEQIVSDIGVSPSASYFPIQFSPSNNSFAYLFWWDNKIDLHNKIVELNYKIDKARPTNGQWNFYRVRDDKTPDIIRGQYGNNFRVAEMTWMNYFVPLTMKDLLTPMSELAERQYFKESKDVYFPLRTFNSFVKEHLLAKISPTNVIDLAAGHGQDLFRYVRKRVKSVLAIDRDKMALMELLNRKYQLIKAHSDTPPIINIAELDLSNDYRENISLLQEHNNMTDTGADMVVCHFALHYIIHDVPSRENFVQLVKRLTRPNGVFVYSSFDGEEIFKLLQDKPQFDIIEDQRTKYSIKRNYKSKDFTGMNQTIGVLLPFSDGQYYDEYLLDSDGLIEHFKKNGFELENTGPFDEMLDLFSKSYAEGYNAMTPADKAYAKYQHYYVFKKTST